MGEVGVGVEYTAWRIHRRNGAFFLSTQAQINFDALTENNALYFAGWLRGLKEDSKFIFKAAAEA